MNEWISSNEVFLRISIFSAIFLLMVAWETYAPFRQLKVAKPRRWLNNISLIVFNTLLLRAIFPIAAVGISVIAEKNGWGILNNVGWHPVISIVFAILILDIVIYAQHVVMHAVPFLWRLHKVHHADLDFDLTTGLRFHPLEIIFSMLVKFAFIIILGAPVLSVIIFEIILNGMSIFNHSNIQLPKTIDKLARWFFVTPDMHRIHHSIENRESNANFCFNFSFWDRLFNTYCENPANNQRNMIVGIVDFRQQIDVVNFFGMLFLPFRKAKKNKIKQQEWIK